MFNTIFSLREDNGFCSPKGPSFKWAPTYTTEFSGNKLRYKIPRHYTNMEIEPFGPLRYYNMLEGYNMESWHESLYPIRMKAFIDRNWSFCGDFFAGKRGVIMFDCLLTLPLDVPENVNFFHPRAFENYIAARLTSKYYDVFSVDRKRQIWNGPLNWQPLGWPIPAARYEMQGDPHELVSFLSFPVGKRHLIEFRSRVVRYFVPEDIKPTPHIDEWTDIKPFRELIDQVYKSVELTLSPQSEQERLEALQAAGSLELIKEFPPLIFEPPKKKI